MDFPSAKRNTAIREDFAGQLYDVTGLSLSASPNAVPLVCTCRAFSDLKLNTTH
jgi:hypothetical protein